MNQIWNQKQLKVPKTAQNFITWWNEPFEVKMAKSAFKHIKTAQTPKVSFAGEIELFEAKIA